jgi:thioredoxin reductase (NADPH)
VTEPTEAAARPGGRGRPVLLTVDDDPGVSRAVARDLRRRYGDRYRVVRASSGEEALDALRELKLRGDPVAALLADYRMPQMNGIEFLEQAMDLFPRARRALLTAYADTDAAIQAINLVDVDHYLLKPWEPPEEKLYPVVDAMVETWLASPDPSPRRQAGRPPLVGAVLPRRDLLARKRRPVPLVQRRPSRTCRRILAAAGAGPDDVPVVVTADARVLKHPGEAELAAVAGLAVDPREEFYDLVSSAAGPAGLGCRRVRRVRGAAHRPRRAGGHRRAGRAEQPDRELPRLPRRGLRWPAGRPRPSPGREVRAELLLARDVGGRSSRTGPRGSLRLDDGRGHRCARRDPCHGVSYRSIGRGRSRRPHRPRRLIRLGVTEAAGVRRPRRLTSSAAPTPPGQARLFFSRTPAQ